MLNREQRFLVLCAKAKQQYDVTSKASRIAFKHLSHPIHADDGILDEVAILKKELTKSLKRKHSHTVSFNKTLHQKISALDQKLTKYLALHVERRKKIKHIEGRVLASNKKATSILRLEKQLDYLAQMATSLGKSAGEKILLQERISAIQMRIERLRRNAKK